MTAVMLLSRKSQQAIDRWCEKFPPDQRQSAVLYALTIVQAENGGWLSVELMDMVAAYLGMPKIAVYEVASFYSLYDLKPVGRNKVMVCTNISCMLCGSEKIVDHLKSRLGVELGETTTDKRFTLKGVECLAACGGAPAMQVNDRYYENLTPEKINTILEEWE